MIRASGLLVAIGGVLVGTLLGAGGLVLITVVSIAVAVGYVVGYITALQEQRS